MKKFVIEVNAFLNKMYQVEVEAEDEELAMIVAEDEVFGQIEPYDIETTAVQL